MTDQKINKVNAKDQPDIPCPPAQDMRPVMKEPLVRMKKRGVVTTRHKAIVYILGFILALLVGALMLLAVGKNPIIAYRDMAVGSFGTKIASAETVRIAIPLLITSVAVGFAFKMKFWNIGAEGQILAGAVAALISSFTDQQRQLHSQTSTPSHHGHLCADRRRAVRVFTGFL